MKPTKTLGILREVKSKWERRVPIAPPQVKRLVDQGLRILIQPCEKRVFKNQEYVEAGAILTEDLSDATTILGVKEFPPHSLLENHNYLSFSHVIKAQPSNMPFLDACMAKNVRLFDYECIRTPPPSNPGDPPSVRLVAFGRFAGLGGMITGLRGLGEHLLAQGAATPFIYMSDSPPQLFCLRPNPKPPQKSTPKKQKQKQN